MLPVTPTFLVMSHVTHFSSIAMKPTLALIYPNYCFFTAFRVRTVQLRWQQYNLGCLQEISRHKLARTAAWTCWWNTVKNILVYIRARAGFNTQHVVSILYRRSVRWCIARQECCCHILLLPTVTCCRKPCLEDAASHSVENSSRASGCSITLSSSRVSAYIFQTTT